MRQPATFVLESLTSASQHFHRYKRWATVGNHHGTPSSHGGVRYGDLPALFVPGWRARQLRGFDQCQTGSDPYVIPPLWPLQVSRPPRGGRIPPTFFPPEHPLTSVTGWIGNPFPSTHRASPLQNFHQFCNALNERGVDMHKVRYGKAEAAFWGVEHLNKAKKKEASVTQTGKDIAKRAADVLHPNEDDGLRKWKREVIFGKGGPS